MTILQYPRLPEVEALCIIRLSIDSVDEIIDNQAFREHATGRIIESVHVPSQTD